MYLRGWSERARIKRFPLVAKPRMAPIYLELIVWTKCVGYKLLPTSTMTRSLYLNLRNSIVTIRSHSG